MNDQEKTVEIVIRAKAETPGAPAKERAADHETGRAQESAVPHAGPAPGTVGSAADTQAAPPPNDSPAPELPARASAAPPKEADWAPGPSPDPEPANPEPDVPGNILLFPREHWARPDAAAGGTPLSQPPGVAAGSAPESSPRERGRPGPPMPDLRFEEAAADAVTHELRSAGDRLRSALERNGEATVSLFQRALGVVEESNRRLGEVERRLEELQSRIRSLNNR